MYDLSRCRGDRPSSEGCIDQANPPHPSGILQLKEEEERRVSDEIKGSLPGLSTRTWLNSEASTPPTSWSSFLERFPLVTPSHTCTHCHFLSHAHTPSSPACLAYSLSLSLSLSFCFRECLGRESRGEEGVCVWGWGQWPHSCASWHCFLKHQRRSQQPAWHKHSPVTLKQIAIAVEELSYIVDF